MEQSVRTGVTRVPVWASKLLRQLRRALISLQQAAMSLRWKLLRFLSVDTLLSPIPADSVDYESSLFPSLNTSSGTNSASTPANSSSSDSNTVLLARFATAADRAVHAHNAGPIYAFALPRAVVQLLNIPSLNLSSFTDASSNTSATSSASTPEAARFPSQVSFSAHENAVIAVHLIYTYDPLPLVITLGLDHSGGSLKIWKLQSPPPPHSKLSPDSDVNKEGVAKPKQPLKKTMNAEDLVECLAVYRFQGDARPTALTVNANLTNIAVGFVDGVVVILTGDIIHERASRIRVAPAPGEMIEPKPIVFLQYAGPLLYGVSEVSIFVISPPIPAPPSNSSTSSSTSQHQQKVTIRRSVLDNLGTNSHNVCCVLHYTQELVVAKPEALFFFNSDGRGPCLGFPTDGKRPLITAVGPYLVHSTGHGSITAYDVSNKLIAYRGKGVATCAFASPPDAKGGKALAISLADGAVLKLSELPLDDRVNMLLKRGLYLPAVRLAKAETGSGGNPMIGRKDSSKVAGGTDNRSTLLKHGNAGTNASGGEVVVKALRQYAEYLMSKNRYDEAAEQLIETIGRHEFYSSGSVFQSNEESVEPSWVITRLVEQSGLRSGLRMYLEALHAAGKAAFVHTKVLITCYRHDRARGAILSNSSNDKTADEYVINVFSDVDWSEAQVDAAISLCRDAGLYRIAEHVARRRGRYVQLALTLVDDLHDPEKVLELLNGPLVNDDEKSLAVVSACAPKLLRLCPMEFVHYLTDAVCKATASSLKSSTSSGGNSNTEKSGIDRTKGVNSSTTTKFRNRAGVHSAPILRLDELLPLFIDCPHWRAALLLQTLSRPGGLPASEAPKAWILLFESVVCMDLGERIRANRGQRRKSRSPKGADYEKRKERIGRKALKILQNRWSVIDLRSALDIAEQYGHSPCLEYLYEHLRMYKELGVSLRLSKNYDGLLRACRRHGEREPNLWLDALRLFVPVAARDFGDGSGDISNKSSGGEHEQLDEFEDGNEGSSETSVLSSSRRNSIRDDSDERYTFGFDDFELFSIGDDNSTANIDDCDDNYSQVDDKNSLLADEENDQDRDSLRTRFSMRRDTAQKDAIRAQDAVDEAMQALERSGILSSLEIIEAVVEACGQGGWGIVREFFERCCSTLRRDAMATEHSAALLETDCEELRAESKRLRDETMVMKTKVCGSCEDALSLPAIHFFCGHSYHVGCLNVSSSARKDSDGQGQEEEIVEECVECAPEVEAALSMKKALVQRNERHDEFFAALRSARDGFATMIEFLERSPFL